MIEKISDPNFVLIDIFLDWRENHLICKNYCFIFLDWKEKSLMYKNFCFIKAEESTCFALWNFMFRASKLPQDNVSYTNMTLNMKKIPEAHLTFPSSYMFIF